MHSGVICVVPVGLPARGKTYMSIKLGRYLRWLDISTAVFSVGSYRRKMSQNRSEAQSKAFEDMFVFIQNGGKVAIYDDTMTVTKSKRMEIASKLEPLGIQVIFIEAECDPSVVEKTVREVKINRPEYEGWNVEDAVKDYLHKISRYEEIYEGLKDETSFIKVSNGVELNFAEHMIMSNVKGHLATRFSLFLLNLHISARTIYLLSNGKTNELYKEDKIPMEKIERAKKASELLKQIRKTTKGLKVYSSTRNFSVETAKFFPTMEEKQSLVELNPGCVDGLTLTEIREKYPEEYKKHELDPFRHRYPRGESYFNLALRLESVILEIEGEKNDVLIIAHDSVLRCLFGYLMDVPESKVPQLEIPTSKLIELAPTFYGSKKSVMHQI